MTVFSIMFYRQELHHEYSQEFLTLFQELDIDIQKTKEEEEKLTVGIRLSFIVNVL